MTKGSTLLRRCQPAALTAILLLGLLVSIAAGPAIGAIPVERVVSPGGIEIWLVPDRRVPVVAIEFAFAGGSSVDPADKAGLSEFAAAAMVEGAGGFDDQAFKGYLEDRAIRLGFSSGRDFFAGSLQTLVSNLDDAVTMANLALTEPRFDPDAVERVRNATIAGLRREMADPSYIARRTFVQTLFPDHSYGQPGSGTPDTVRTITTADLHTLVNARFAKDRLLVAACGDVTPEALGQAVDRLFAGIPDTTDTPTVPDVEPANLGRTVVVPHPAPQTQLVFGHAGVGRGDPDWYAATVLNYVLGGGGFSSRIMEEVREKRGLSYGVYTLLNPLRHTSLLLGSGSTINERAAETLSVIKEIWAETAKSGITQEELDDAKTYLTGAYPLQFSSTRRIADLLLGVRQFDLGIDYVNDRNELINAVTLEQVNAVASRLLQPDQLTVVAVGGPEGIEATAQLGQ